jgi:hypothetical protein
MSSQADPDNQDPEYQPWADEANCDKQVDVMEWAETEEFWEKQQRQILGGENMNNYITGC